MNATLTAVKDQLCGYFEEASPAEAQLTFLGATPITLLRFGPDRDSIVTYASLGCSAEPMVDPGELMPDYSRGPRAEIFVSVHHGIDEIIRPLAMLAASPSIEGLVLQPNALLDFASPLWAGARFTGFVLLSADIPSARTADGSEVAFLRAVPTTPNEFAFARAKGIDELKQLWDQCGTDFADPHRASVV